MTYTEFVAVVADMRAKQKAYYAAKRRGYDGFKELAESKAAEKRVDGLIVELNEPMQLRFGSGEE